MEEQPLQRTSLYDVRPPNRLGIDLKHGAFFGAVGLALTLVSFKQIDETLALRLFIVATLLIYFAILSLPFRAQLATLVLFSFSLLVAPSHAPEVLRVIAFAALMIPASHSRMGIAPFFALTICWAGYLALALPYFDSLHVSVRITPNLARRATLEIFGLLVLSFVLWSNRVSSLLNRNQRAVDTRSILIAISLVGALGCCLIICRTFIEVFHLNTDELFAVAAANMNMFLLTAVGVLGLPILVGLAFGQVINDFVSQLHELSSPEKRAFRTSRGIPVIREFRSALNELRSIIDHALQSYRDISLKLKEIIATEGQREDAIHKRELDAENLEKLMNAAPLGYIAVSGSGAVLAVNRKFFEVTHTDETPLVGQHFIELSGEHLWRQEIVDILSGIIEEYQVLEEREFMRYFSSSVEGKYLQLELRITKSSVLDLNETHPSDRISPSQYAISLFVREEPDLRDFQLRLLYPSTIQILGCQAIELSRGLRRDLQGLSTALTHASPHLHKLRQDSRFASEGEIALLVREVEQFVNRSLAELDSFSNALNPRTDMLERFNLVEICRHSLSNLYLLLGRNDQPRILIDDNEATQNSSQGLVVAVHPTEFNGFVASLLALVHSILPQASRLNVSLGIELIGAGTANIIPGSAPGEYARIVLSHPGQSITPNMMRENIRSLDPIVNEPGDPEHALSLVSLFTQRLSGFLSIQSSHNKGTTITIYIPREPGLVERRPREIERKRELERALPTQQITPTHKALLVVSDSELSARIEQYLKRLNFAVVIEEPFSSNEFDENACGFGGVGFGSPVPQAPADSPKSEASPSISSNPDDFDLVLLELSMVNINAQEIFKQIRRGEKIVPILVIGVDPPEDGIPEQSAFLNTAIDESVLRRAMQKLVKS